jgi:hypothetical protein
MFGLGKSTSRLGESSSSVRTGNRRLLRLLRRRYLRSGVGRSGAAMRVLSRPGLRCVSCHVLVLRLPRFRFTVRWLLLAVAIAALCGGSSAGQPGSPGT